jgi:ABC-type uncharacterized transport system substrate-binding protein
MISGISRVRTFASSTATPRDTTSGFPSWRNELVGLNVDVILTWSTDAVLAAKQATGTIPIIMGAIGDPLGIGVVTNLAHPGANIIWANPSELVPRRADAGMVEC